MHPSLYPLPIRGKKTTMSSGCHLLSDTTVLLFPLCTYCMLARPLGGARGGEERVFDSNKRLLLLGNEGNHKINTTVSRWLYPVIG